MAAPVLVVWVGSARWSGRSWIVRRRRVRPARLGCRSLSRAAPAGAWPGSASTSAACRAGRPLALATFMPSRVRSRIRSDSNSATIANTLNSSRPRGSVGSWVEPPRLRFTSRLVSSSKMSRASGSASDGTHGHAGQVLIANAPPAGRPSERRRRGGERHAKANRCVIRRVWGGSCQLAICRESVL